MRATLQRPILGDAFFVANLQIHPAQNTPSVRADTAIRLTGNSACVGAKRRRRPDFKKIEAGAATKYFYWNKAIKRTRVVVNGERLPESGFFSGISDGNEEFSSLKVYARSSPDSTLLRSIQTRFHLLHRARSKRQSYSGMSDIAYDSAWRSSSTPVVDTSSVGVSIDYQGESPTELPPMKREY